MAESARKAPTSTSETRSGTDLQPLQRARQAVGDRDDRVAAGAGGLDEGDGLGAVGGEGDGEDGVARAERVAGGEQADGGVQHAGHRHLLQRVGEVARDREGAAVADEVDQRGGGQHVDGAFEHFRVDGGHQVLERGAAGLDELGEQRAGAALAGGAQVAQPGGVVGPLAGVFVAEQPLHLAEAGEAEVLAEAHHRRGLDVGEGGELGDGGDGDAVGVAGDEVGALAQALRAASSARSAIDVEQRLERRRRRAAMGWSMAGLPLTASFGSGAMRALEYLFHNRRGGESKMAGSASG